MTIARRNVLLAAAATAAALATKHVASAAPAATVISPAIPATPTPATKHDVRDPEVVDRDLVDVALGTVCRLWDYPPVQGEAFGYKKWMVSSTGALRTMVQKAALRDRDPRMWGRVLLWVEIGMAFEKKFGANVETQRGWILATEPIPGMNMTWYLLQGDVDGMDSALKTLEAA